MIQRKRKEEGVGDENERWKKTIRKKRMEEKSLEEERGDEKGINKR